MSFEYQYYKLRYGEKNAVDSLHLNKQQQNWQKIMYHEANWGTLST